MRYYFEERTNKIFRGRKRTTIISIRNEDIKRTKGDDITFPVTPLILQVSLQNLYSKAKNRNLWSKIVQQAVKSTYSRWSRWSMPRSDQKEKRLRSEKEPFERQKIEVHIFEIANLSGFSLWKFTAKEDLNRQKQVFLHNFRPWPAQKPKILSIFYGKRFIYKNYAVWKLGAFCLKIGSFPLCLL